MDNKHFIKHIVYIFLLLKATYPEMFPEKKKHFDLTILNFNTISLNLNIFKFNSFNHWKYSTSKLYKKVLKYNYTIL